MNDQYLPMALDHMLADAPGHARRRASRAMYREAMRLFSEPEDKGEAAS